MTRMDRRLFLQTAAAATVGLVPASIGGAAHQAGTDQSSHGGGRGSAQAADRALVGAPGTRLFSGCCAMSYSKYLRNGQMTLEDFIRKAVDLRLHGVDVTVYFLKSTEPAYLTSLRHLAFKNGIAFSGAACGANMVEADTTKRAQVLEDIKKWIEVTDRLGASHLRVFGGKLPAGATTDQGIAWCAEVMKAAADHAGARGITLGLEEHVGITQQSETILEIIRRVDSPHAGINLDITHFIPKPTLDAYAQIEACVPHATHAHIRFRFDDWTPIDLDRVWQIFARGGYKGYMSAEYETEKEDPMTGVPRLTAEIRRLCAKYSTV